jgi:mono/diheme cytochrome c family protein
VKTRERLQIFLLLSVIGCQPHERDFVPSDRRGQLIPEAACVVELTLTERYGTLQQPVLSGALPIEFGEAGRILLLGRNVYTRHCTRCHGASGDGNGPTAHYLNPRPRDLRRGEFKFTSTRPMEKASRNDLKAMIVQGMPGTYMPSFELLDESETDAVIEYVRWLALRGESERRLVAEFYADYSASAVAQRLQSDETIEEIRGQLDVFCARDYPALVNDWDADLSTAWERAEDDSVQVIAEQMAFVESDESPHQGRSLYRSEKAKCVICHGEFGQGHGLRTFEYSTIPGTNARSTRRGLYDDWGYRIAPRDLTRGIMRVGNLPVDLYRRVAAGIKGTPMPPAAALTEEEIWDLVSFIMSLKSGNALGAIFATRH